MDKQSKSKPQKSEKPTVSRTYLLVFKQDHDSYYYLRSDKKEAVKLAKKLIKEAAKNYGFTKEEEKVEFREKVSVKSSLGECVYAAFLENDSVEVFELKVNHEDDSK